MKALVNRIRDTQALAKLIGETKAFRESLHSLPIVAKCDSSVLITGETGTGKELVARAIHYLSERAAFPFVPVNCGRLPETLLEDELFGHERGAFTDAHTQRTGFFAEAEKGTVFLDEVEALSPKGQVVLLRVLEQKTYTIVGSCRERATDVRIVAATNAPLDQLVRDGAFRSDLYYRLFVFSINLPPLRERKGDILLLARHFMQKHTPAGRPVPQISPSAAHALYAHDWPGNVRELENAIIRGVHLCQNNSISVEDIGLQIDMKTEEASSEHSGAVSNSMREMKRRIVQSFEKDYLDILMQKYKGNVSRAAAAAGKERREFGKLLKKYGIDPQFFRNHAADSSQ